MVTSIRSYHAGDEILRSADFETLYRFEVESAPFRGDTLVELEGDPHLGRRKIHSGLFAREALLAYERGVLRTSIERGIRQAVGADGRGSVRANLVPLARRMLLMVAGAVIGLDDLDRVERASLLEAYMYPLTEAVDIRWSTADHEEVIREAIQAKDGFIRDFLQPAVARRRDLVARAAMDRAGRSSLPLDLITLMVLHTDRASDDDLIAREAILYLTGSTLTTSAAMVHAARELWTWLDSHPDGHLLTKDPAFLRATANETIRLHPASPRIIRRAIRDTALSTGWRLQRGDVVAVELSATNRDPDVFGRDPERFRPDRVVPRRVRPYGLSFGAGRHVCIGRPLVTNATGGLAGEGEVEPALVVFLQAVIEWGIVPDPGLAPAFAASAEGRYESLPVLIQHPGVKGAPSLGSDGVREERPP